MGQLRPETFRALGVYRAHFPDGLPKSAAELAARIQKLPKSASGELRAFVADASGIEELRGAHALLMQQSTAGEPVEAAIAVAKAAGKLHRPGATIRNHPTQLTVERPAPEVPALPRELRTVREIVAWLVSHNFEEKDNGGGSHSQWVGPNGHKVTVPLHHGEIKPGTLSAIRRQIAKALEPK